MTIIMILKNTVVLCVFLVISVAARSMWCIFIFQVYSGVFLEGPHWSRSENALYWVDILAQKLLRMDETGNVTSRNIGYGPPSLVVSVKDYPKMLLVTVRSGVYLLNWDAEPGDNALRLLSVVDVGLPDNRCNDGKVDANGRLFFGTIGKEVGSFLDKDKASLYMIDEYNYQNPEIKVRPVSVSNGIAWTSDSKFMFYIDTPTRNIDVFDFNLESGTIRKYR
ncbi:unnamed protein product [Diatraea saccharalis]|uniref:SMP-30/Gluconolactonase/LRE-like region domain-containing protein n=1 Tax=Diatraea saccharalis TaxID=40085 RepID=A0A9N9WIQ0_9NEOP|nr:unnamed protein product [Diatraea saccharalis]